jgi:hypothetical protein
VGTPLAIMMALLEIASGSLRTYSHILGSHDGGYDSLLLADDRVDSGILKIRRPGHCHPSSSPPRVRIKTPASRSWSSNLWFPSWKPHRPSSLTEHSRFLAVTDGGLRVTPGIHKALSVEGGET